MGEVPRGGYEINDEDIGRADEVFRLIETEIRQQRYSDPVEGSCLKAVYLDFMAAPPGSMPPHHGRVKDTMTAAAALRRQRGSFFPKGYALRCLEFSLDKQMRRLFSADIYPVQADNEEFWSAAFGLLDFYELFTDLQFDLQSNMADTGAIYQAILAELATSGRWEGLPTVLDNGISHGQPWRKFFTTGFRPVRALRQPPPYRPIVPDELQTDQELQSIINPLYDLPPAAGQVIGYDTVPIIADTANNLRRLEPESMDALQLLFSQTFPFGESVRRAAEAAEFWQLALTPLPTKVVIPKVSIDARDPGSLSQLDEILMGVPAQVGILQAMLYEHPYETAVSIIENVKPYVADFLFIADFIKTPQRRTGRPLDYKKFDFIRGAWWQRPGAFAMYAIDLKSQNQELVEIARFTNRRATEAFFMPGGKYLLRHGRLP